MTREISPNNVRGKRLGFIESRLTQATSTSAVTNIVSCLFLMVCLYRLSQFHFSRQHHFGFEAAA